MKLCLEYGNPYCNILLYGRPCDFSIREVAHCAIVIQCMATGKHAQNVVKDALEAQMMDLSHSQICYSLCRSLHLWEICSSKLPPEIRAVKIDWITNNAAPHWSVVLKFDTLVHLQSPKTAEFTNGQIQHSERDYAQIVIVKIAIFWAGCSILLKFSIQLSLITLQ